jgi:subfamily B ATP-binding cassette protein MsbA
LIKLLTPVGIAWVVGKAINVLTAAHAGTLTTGEAWAQLHHLLLLGLGVALFAPIPVYLRSALAARAVQEVIRNLRCDLYAHIQKLPHAFFDANRSGSLTSRIISDTEAIQPFVGKAFVQVWMSVGLITVVLIYFFSQSPLLGTIAIFILPLQMLVQRLIGWKVKENAKKIRSQVANLFGSTQEKLAASTIVKTFTGEDDEVQRFAEDSGALVALGVSNSRLNGMSEGSMNFIRSLSQLLVIGIGGYLALFHAPAISIGLLIQFVLMQSQLYTPFEWLNEMQLIIADAQGATERIFTIFDTAPEIADKPNAVKAPHFTGEIYFDHVTFTYPGAMQPVISDLDLHVPARTTLALVGPSGSGKTTITHLVNRFYEWETGHILIDGRDVRDYTIYSLRHQIGLVPQEAILFSGTIEENILYGRPGASFADVEEAAKRAYAHEFIELMDDGYQSMLGERGIKLSGGQKQRISIARAFLKNPAIIILDEATSALDSESERIVQQALEDLMANRTTLVIAHRLSTIRHADNIAVIDGGRLVEYGPHETLLQQDGLYSSLCRQQFGEPQAMISPGDA